MTWSSTLAWNSAQQRAKLIAKIRAYFSSQEVIEVETPLLSAGTITDLHLDAFITKYDFLCDNDLSHSADFYLQTSPEFSMKRLLASGYGCIYQICKAFRHEAYGNYHNPEFTMLEWYRVGQDHFQLMNDVERLLQSVLECGAVERVTYQNLFLNTLNIDPLDTSLQELTDAIKSYDKLSDWLIEEHDIDVLLQFIFSEIIEPTIGNETPCFVYDFPSSQASLAKISSSDARVALRFECYFKGVELANGFNELTCAKEQRRRFEEDNVKRIERGLAIRPIDENFLTALEHGLPKCSGVALGVDRLLMLALKKQSIKNVITFPIEHA